MRDFTLAAAAPYPGDAAKLRTPMAENTLYYGDNLDVLRRYISDECVDLIYLDPPFKSDQDYNVLFAEHDGRSSAAQIRAFEDTWEWTDESAESLEQVIEQGGRVADVMRALRTFLDKTDMMAYLAMMAPRLVEMRRVLKSTGSLYLHCDPTASHYLKILLDAVFGAANFRNEIVWRRSHPKGLAFTRFATSHDVILVFQKTQKATWNPTYLPNGNANTQYTLADESGRRYQLTSLLNPNPDRPNLTYEFKGVTKVWRWTRDRMEEADRKGLIVVPKRGEGIPRFKRYLDEQEGIPVGDFWNDIGIAAGHERLGYPTQKPQALLARIIAASSNAGDLILDPFCGCGTAIDAAQRLGRRWIGIDITHLAVGLIKHRLFNSFHLREKRDYDVVGEPVSLDDARRLARDDPFQFQAWALGLVGARRADQKRGADSGIDGRLFFHETRGGRTKQVLFSVKSGQVGVRDVRDLRAVVEREHAEMGLLISLAEPTRPMLREAADGGHFVSEFTRSRHPKLQIRTIKQLLEGKGIDAPPVSQLNRTFQRARRVRPPVAEVQLHLSNSTPYDSE